MEKIVTRYLVVIGITCCAAFAVNLAGYASFENSGSASGEIARIPQSLGKWTGTDVLLDEQVYRILETRSIIHRNYRSVAGDVFLSIVHYPETKVDFHAPEGCLAGKGIQISKSVRKIRIWHQGQEKEIMLNQLIRRNGEYEELIYYFYKAGDFMGEGYMRLRLSLVLNRFFSNSRSGSLIRVSTPLIGQGFEGSSAALTEFLEALYPYAIRYL